MAQHRQKGLNALALTPGCGAGLDHWGRGSVSEMNRESGVSVAAADSAFDVTFSWLVSEEGEPGVVTCQFQLGASLFPSFDH